MTQTNDGLAERFRSQMPIHEHWAYMDHAAVGPLPKNAHEAILEWLTVATNDGDTQWMSWFHQLVQLRERSAKLMNASVDEIALLPSTTAGINIVAEGFPWKKGDNVVTLENEFPSNLFPWLNLARQEVETRTVPVVDGRVDPNRIDEACDDRTRLVSVSWVGYASGWRVDVQQITKIAHRHGALMMLDAIQGLGVFPLDVEKTGVDFVAADGHKWMLGPEGAGIFYMRKEHLKLMNPVAVGWKSVERSFDFGQAEFKLRDSAARYEGGTMNMAGFIGLGASLELLWDLGVRPDQSAVADLILDIAAYARQRLRESGIRVLNPDVENHNSGIVTVATEGPPEAMHQICKQQRIALSCRGGGLRVSLHGYNHRDEVDRLIDVMKTAKV